jgi:hypothetical protein
MDAFFCTFPSVFLDGTYFGSGYIKMLKDAFSVTRCFHTLFIKYFFKSMHTL